MAKIQTDKHPGGRPTKYLPEHCAGILAWFSVPKYARVVKKESWIKKTGRHDIEYETLAGDLPTFEGFARSIGVNGDTIVEWAKKHPEFSAAYNAAKQLQKEFLIDNGLKGHYPPASFIFVSKNITDLRDKQEVESTKTFDVTGLGDLTDEQLDELIKGLQNRAGDRAARENAAA